jgi:hypothetical protein
MKSDANSRLNGGVEGFSPPSLGCFSEPVPGVWPPEGARVPLLRSSASQPDASTAGSLVEGRSQRPHRTAFKPCHDARRSEPLS